MEDFYIENFYLDLCVVLGVAALQLVRRHREKSLSFNELFHSREIRLFPNIDLQSMNDSFLNTLKYLCNYGTYRFGLELSLFASLCLIILRMDAIALIHAIILLIWILLPRQYVRRFWKLYRIFASISAVWLYLNALGEFVHPHIDECNLFVRTSTGFMFKTCLRSADISMVAWSTVAANKGLSISF